MMMDGSAMAINDLMKKWRVFDGLTAMRSMFNGLLAMRRAPAMQRTAMWRAFNDLKASGGGLTAMGSMLDGLKGE